MGLTTKCSQNANKNALPWMWGDRKLNPPDKSTKTCDFIAGREGIGTYKQIDSIKTLAECIKNCETAPDCGGYTFSDTTFCRSRGWGSVWDVKDKTGSSTGTCDHKPAERFSMIGCYAD